MLPFVEPTELDEDNAAIKTIMGGCSAVFLYTIIFIPLWALWKLYELNKRN